MHRALKDIAESTLQRTLTNVVFVANPLSAAQVLENIRKFMTKTGFLNVTKVLDHSVHFPTVNAITVLIKERNVTDVKNVANLFLHPQDLKYIREFILERDLTNVRSVTNPLPTVPVSGDIRKLIELRNILAQIVVKTCISFHTLKAITDSILERTRTNAVSVTDPFPTMNYLEFIKKLILQK